jgi:hypothetical protein
MSTYKLRYTWLGLPAPSVYEDEVIDDLVTKECIERPKVHEAPAIYNLPKAYRFYRPSDDNYVHVNLNFNLSYETSMPTNRFIANLLTEASVQNCEVPGIGGRVYWTDAHSTKGKSVATGAQVSGPGLVWVPYIHGVSDREEYFDRLPLLRDRLLYIQYATDIPDEQPCIPIYILQSMQLTDDDGGTTWKWSPTQATLFKRDTPGLFLCFLAGRGYLLTIKEAMDELQWTASGKGGKGILQQTTFGRWAKSLSTSVNNVMKHASDHKEDKKDNVRGIMRRLNETFRKEIKNTKIVVPFHYARSHAWHVLREDPGDAE